MFIRVERQIMQTVFADDVPRHIYDVIRQLDEDRRKISGIKFLRAHYGLGLGESKALYEHVVVLTLGTGTTSSEQEGLRTLSLCARIIPHKPAITRRLLWLRTQSFALVRLTTL